LNWLQELSTGQFHLSVFDSPLCIKQQHAPKKGACCCLLLVYTLDISLQNQHKCTSVHIPMECVRMYMESPTDLRSVHRTLGCTSVCTGAVLSIPPAIIKISHPHGWDIFMVEPRGIEPLSESNLTRLSPSAVCYLHSLIPPGTNTLRNLVASLCMVWAKLTIRTVSTQITPEPGSWTFRGGWAPN